MKDLVHIASRPVSVEVLELYVGDRAAQTPQRHHLETLYLYLAALEDANVKLQSEIARQRQEIKALRMPAA